MNILHEYVLNPDVFDRECYGGTQTTSDSRSEICSVYLKTLQNVLLQEALVRDLYNGEWKKYVKQMISSHPNTKYILKELAKQRRLRCARAISQNVPSNYTGWCDEALKSHQQEPLSGVIASKEVAKVFSTDLVSSIERLEKVKWWNNRSSSVRLNRKTSDYIHHLKLIFSHANSLMFIDPYLDPVKYNYREFDQILSAIQNHDIQPKIEIHMSQLSISFKEYENDFRSKLSDVITSKGLKVKVFIWDYIHDRYLISDIIGINLNQGFDISDKPDEKTTWTRLGRSDKDDIQREFDPTTRRHKLQYQFDVG